MHFLWEVWYCSTLSQESAARLNRCLKTIDEEGYVQPQRHHALDQCSFVTRFVLTLCPRGCRRYPWFAAIDTADQKVLADVMLWWWVAFGEDSEPRLNLRMSYKNR